MADGPLPWNDQTAEWMSHVFLFSLALSLSTLCKLS